MALAIEKRRTPISKIKNYKNSILLKQLCTKKKSESILTYEM